MASGEIQDKAVAFELAMAGSGLRLSATVSVPQGPVQLTELLPIARSISEALVGESIKSAEESGQKISCRKGCGACCRQLVAISVVEAGALAEVVAAMPLERQAVVRARFAAALSRLEEASLLEPNSPADERALIAGDLGSREASLQALSQRYFRLQIPCPFLENEACSIHDDRPLVCREYHVTSPAERCAKLFDQPVDRVEVPIHLGHVVSSTAAIVNKTSAYAVPLVLALEWSEKHGELLERRYDSEQMVQALLGELRAAGEKALPEVSNSLYESSSRINWGDSTTPSFVTRLIDPAGNQAAGVQMAKIEFIGTDWQLETTVSVPKGRMAASELLPIARAMVDSIADAATKSVAANGKDISCKKGCGACCRQLVPIAGVEARKLRDLIEAQPEPRRSEIYNRFAAARRRLEEFGLLEKLRTRADWEEREVAGLGLKYFFAGIACPFLENESCSIYADRPLACREYLVTSPAENCTQPSAQTIDQVRLPFKAWPALARLDRSKQSGRFIPWVPLVLAPEWANDGGTAEAEITGIELLHNFSDYLAATNTTAVQRDYVASPDLSTTPSNQDHQSPIGQPGATEVLGSFSPQMLQANSRPQDFPLRLGSAEDFVRVRTLFRAAHFDDATICRIFALGDMSDIGSVDRKRIHISGLLGLMVRLFLFIESISRAEVDAFIDGLTLKSLMALDLIRLEKFGTEDSASIDKYYCPVWLYPIGEFLIASDRGRNPDGSTLVRMADIVFPAIYEGTLRFLRMIPKTPGEMALDLCAGSGIAALMMSRYAKRAVAADITARASHFAQFNGLLNGCDNLEVACGDLYGAVQGQMFDLIVAHPPFVPSASDAVIYRDSGHTGEALIKRIIEGLPQFLRPGGKFCCVCAAWDTKDGRFEDRVRSWLGEQHADFDIVYALHRELPPEQIAKQLPEIRESGDPSLISRWSNLFREAGFETNVYGAIVLYRKDSANMKFAAIAPVTQRFRLGELTDGSSFDQALRWLRWRQRQEAADQLMQTLAVLKPRLAANLKVKVTHQVRAGSLAVEDVLLESRQPFSAVSRVDPWMLDMLAQFDGRCTPREIYEKDLGRMSIPESFKLENFVALVASMLGKGHLELDGAILDS